MSSIDDLREQLELRMMAELKLDSPTKDIDKLFKIAVEYLQSRDGAGKTKPGGAFDD